MLTIYPACFFKEYDGRYTVVFPDLDWLATQGDDLEDAIAMAVDCVEQKINFSKVLQEGLKRELKIV